MDFNDEAIDASVAGAPSAWQGPMQNGGRGRAAKKTAMKSKIRCRPASPPPSPIVAVISTLWKKILSYYSE